MQSGLIRISAFLSSIVLTVLLVSSAFASTVVQLDMESLVSNSSQIVLGEVVEIDERVEDDGRVYSYITLKVEESLKGTTGSTITIRQLGGRSGDLATIVPGMPEFQRDEKVVLFLESHHPDAPPVITGMSQGKFRITVGPDDATHFVVPQLNSIKFVTRSLQMPKDETIASPDLSVQPRIRLRTISPHELYSTVFELNDFRAQILTIVHDQETN